MGVAYNSRIITDGLVLALDAANNKSILSTVEVLVVAGGGAGGNGTGSGYESGGGGAGGLIYSSSHSITPGSAITVTVGAGGASATSSTPAANGANSVFGALTAIGGGGGATAPAVGSSGGSGGGGSHNQTGGGSGTAGQGFSGATPAQGSSGGGGGGAGGPGKSTSSNADGSGGIGLPFSISGSLQYYAGGGGGSRHTDVSGGLGGGGAGVSLSAGYANGSPGGTNTGGGGGGANQPATNTGGGAGGSGIIIVRYPGSQRASGGTVTSVGGYTIHTFTTSGTFTPTWGDMSTNGNTGTLTNGPTYSSANGGSIVFDGSNDYIDCGDTFSLSITIGTVCAWFKKPHGSVYKGLVDKGRDGYGAWSLNVDEVGNTATFKARISGTNRSIIASSNYGNNIWTYVCGVYDGTTLAIYQNGIISNSASYSGTIGTNSVSVKIGSASDGLHFDGNIAQASIYNRALSAAEISQNFNALRGRFGI